MAKIDYWGIEQELAEILRANLTDVVVEVEREMNFPAEATPWLGIYLDRRTMPDNRQSMSAGRRMVVRLNLSIWAWCFALEHQQAVQRRDEIVGEIETILMANRTLNETVDSLWITGGAMPGGRVSNAGGGFSGFVSGAEIAMLAELAATI